MTDTLKKTKQKTTAENKNLSSPSIDKQKKEKKVRRSYMSEIWPITIFGNCRLTLPENYVWPGGTQAMPISESWCPVLGVRCKLFC